MHAPGRFVIAALLALCLTASTLAAARDYQLPSIGQPADAYMSPAEEDKIGRQIVAQLLGRSMIIEDPLLREYLARIGNRLAQQSGIDASAFHFYPIDSGQINAFALPGGYIGINAGLITETENESELAGVVAHEMAHVSQRHIARRIEATAGMGWATMAAVLLAAIAGGGDPDAISAAVAGGMSSMGQQRTNYTRANEFEADRIGIGTLAAAGYNPDAMASFFEKMQRRSRLYANQLPQILLSHPVSDTRMAEAEIRARDYSTPTVHESDAYPLMRERARVMAAVQLGSLARYYEQRRDAGGETSDAALDYGHALVLTRLGRHAQAIDLLAPLAERFPAERAYILALADAHGGSGDTSQALALLDAARERFPDSAAVALDYADRLVEANQAEEARRFLLAHRDMLDDSSRAQELLARIAGDEGNLGEAYFRQARYYRSRGAYAQAINQLRTALQTADLSAFDQSRLRALLEQTVRTCHASWSERECRAQVAADTRY